jgi:hypothetical protein
MYELKKMERYLRVNLLGPGPRVIKKKKKKNLPGRGLTKVEKHCYSSQPSHCTDWAKIINCTNLKRYDSGQCTVD